MSCRTRWRTAQAIAAQLNAALQERPELNLPTVGWLRVQALERRHRLALARGWHTAAAKTRASLQFELLAWTEELTLLRSQLREGMGPPSVLASADVYRDLEQLELEFGEVRYVADEQRLSVVTDPITLEEIALGPFRIELDLNRLTERSPFVVEALEPNPAASNPSVVHPHVSNERLCEGDGRGAIARALAEGRLLDFFVVVERLLQTYAVGRAYVELDHWFGQPCRECSQSLDPDDAIPCHSCEEPACHDCLETCPWCEYAYCSDCLESCSGCHQRHCTRCQVACERCGQASCPDCRDDAGYCAPCAEALAAEAEAPLHADGLGEAEVSA